MAVYVVREKSTGEEKRFGESGWAKKSKTGKYTLLRTEEGKSKSEEPKTKKKCCGRK